MASRETGQEMLRRLRAEPFNRNTDQSLASHPYLKSAEMGTLTLGQRQALAQEQYFIQISDAISFASLAGHSGFVPSSLKDATTPDPVRTPAEGSGDVDLFQFLLGGEIYSFSLLLDYANSFGLDEASLFIISDLSSCPSLSIVLG
jgi:hypothetical protein